MSLIILIVILLLVFGGGGGYYGYRRCSPRWFGGLTCYPCQRGRRTADRISFR